MNEQHTIFDDGTWKHELRSIKDLVPNPKNPRIINEETLVGLRQSMKDIGYTHRIVIDCHNNILSGHARWLVISHDDPEAIIECLVAQRELTQEEIDRAIIAHNTNGGKWDIPKLVMEFEPVVWSRYNIELERPPEMVMDELEQVKEVDTPDVEPEETIAKRGDIWQLGNHRLLCGDSTSVEELKALMGDKLADCVLTDPPYNVNVQNSEGMTIKNDHMSDEKFQKFLNAAFKTADTYLKPGGVFYIWHADGNPGIAFRTAAANVGWTVRQNLIWNKNTFTLGRQDYQNKHEPCLYGWKDGAAHYFIDDRRNATVVDLDEPIDFDKMKKEELVTLLKSMFANTETTVIDEPKPQKNTDHPTMKPIRLIARQIKNSTKRGDIVLDLFGGSGSTLIACEQLGRTCYINELDEHYCDVIIKRWENTTGQKAVKIN